ncbi:Lipase 1 [Cytospora mali]|uniref:Lipase 1 n=1 Tax=Cytospora mali TaxID=578113 RepID=A0A194USG7_CYTMA|nr:Lipase 1 [Valsa mali var. pyri (nom. inval.)]
MASPTPDIRITPQRHDNPKHAEPIPPLQDPWYTAPHGFEGQKPGTVLRLREAPGNLTSLVTNCSAAYNILYRTTNSRYQPDWAVTTVFIPITKAPALLSFQIPYDSAFLDASPSYSLYSPDSVLYYTEISTALASGWFFNVPDYEGPLASFTAGVQSGHATIDSIRAVLASHKKLGLAKDARYAMWGFSGGALASEWAAELQVQYAPEMNFSGAALGGLTPNVTSVLYTINRSAGVGLVPTENFRAL